MQNILAPLGEHPISLEQEALLRDCCKDEESFQRAYAMLLQATIETKIDNQSTQAIQAFPELVALIGTKFRIPLHTIAMSAEMLTRYAGKLTPTRRDMHFDRIRKQVYFLRDMVQNIALITTLDEQPLFHPTPFFEMCARLEADLQMSASYTSALVFRYNSNETKSLHIDYEVVKQVAENLVANALKYSDSGHPITITLRKLESTWELQVADEGIGIPRRDSDKVFQAYYRGDNVGLRPGMGLGLHNAKKLTTAMGGKLTIESSGSDMGTVATVALPIKIDDDLN